MKRAKVAILIAAFCGPLGCDQQGDPSVGSDTESSQSGLFWADAGILPKDPNGVWSESVCFASGSKAPQITSYKEPGGCVDVQNAQFADWTPVQLYPCNGTDAQKWTVVDDGTGNGTFNIKAGGMCLDVYYGVGPNVQLYTCNQTPAQQWTPKASGDNMDVVRLKNKATGQCLELPASYTPSTPVQLRVNTCLDYDGMVAGCNMECVCDASVTPANVALCQQQYAVRQNQNQQRWRLPDALFPRENQNQMHDAIANSWAAVTQVIPSYWGPCESLSEEEKTRLLELHYRAGATGMAGAYGFPDSVSHRGISMNLEGEEAGRGMIVHEFGHVLGFLHEQGRFENQPSTQYPKGPYCQNFQDNDWNAEPGHSGGTGTYGVFDPESVDNYCDCNRTNGATGAQQGWMLSRNDILGAQRNYGKRTFKTDRWHSGTARSTNHKPSSGSDTLSVGAQWSSPDGVVALTLQSDGQLAVIRTDLPLTNGNPPTTFAPLWLSGKTDTYSPASPVAQFGTNGILQVYDTKAKKIVWQSTTTSYTGATLSIQQDGNVVITDTKKTIRWQTNTAHRSELDGAVGLIPGATLAAGNSLQTSSGAFKLSMDTGGNLSLYQNTTKLWSKGFKDARGVAAQGAKMMLDGTFCLVNASGQCVSTISSYKAGGNFLALQEDGNLVVYEPLKYAIWRGGGLQRQWGHGQVLDPPEYGNPADPVIMWNGSSLSRGQTLTTPSGKAKLTMQMEDGNLVVYVNKGTPTSPNWFATWYAWPECGTEEENCNFATLTGDRDSSGNILPGGGALRVLTSPTGIVRYDSNTSGFRNTYLAVTDDGIITIYRVVTTGANSTGANSIGFAY